VALVDADLGLANLDVLINADAQANLSHVIAGVKTLEEVIIDLPCGVQFVPGASGLARLANLSDFQRAQLVRSLLALESDNDLVIVDCGAGIGPDVLQFACAADTAVVVTAPEPTAITDAYALIKVLSQREYRGQVTLLVNQAQDRREARITHERIAEVAQRFLNLRVLSAGYVLTDPKVKDAVRRREPFVLAYPRCEASRCLAALANKLADSGSLGLATGGFFRKVVNWFA
jgi:flagellar biosynthesis protein FlhG